MNIPEIKSRLSMQEILRHYGLKPNRSSMLNCPFHPDKKPSMQFYEDTNTVYCFSANCELQGKSIDQIDFILHKEGYTKREAIEKAKELAGIIEISKKENLEETFKILIKDLHNSINARQYLKSRKIYDFKAEVGFNRKTLKELRGCVVFPLKDKEGKIVSLYGRRVTNGSNIAKTEADCDSNKNFTNYVPGCHYYTTNRQGLYPCYPYITTKKLIITESIIDALSIKMYTKYQVLALYGTNGFNNEHREAISRLTNIEEIIFFMDGDDAGRKAISKYSKEIHKLCPEITISVVNTPENEDANSLLQSHEVGVLDHLIKNRSAIYNKKIKINEIGTEIVKTGRLNTSNTNYLFYKGDDVHITILGGINLFPIDRLKITFLLKKPGSLNPDHTIRDSLDLYKDDSVDRITKKISSKLEISNKDLRITMSEMTTELEEYRKEQIENQKPRKAPKRILTDKRKNIAIDWLKKPELLKRTNQLIGESGVVGEEINRLLMYLIFTSRIREQPLHIMSLGASASGKTYLQETVGELIPKEEKIEITTLSENALYYYKDKELKNKLLLIEDLDGAQEDKIRYALRELMSKRKITKTVPIKDNKGKFETITLEVEGPISLGGTTTKEKIYEDNANRSILIYLDNGKKQKDAIMNYQRGQSFGDINHQKEAEIKEFVKDVQSVLKPIKVKNPYAKQLVIPEVVFKPLRTNAHYLSFIEIITFYKQYQREVKVDSNGESYIETHLEDIKEANFLLKDVLLAKSDELTKASRNFLEMIKRYLKERNKTTFYSKELRQEYRITPTTLKRHLGILCRYDYIKIIGGSRVSGFEYEMQSQDSYNSLKQNIDNVLDDVLKKLEMSGPVVH